MSYLQRKMFANGGGVMGPARPIGDYQIKDKITGEILIDLSQRPDFINTPGFNPYKILYDDTLEKGPAVLAILQNFQKRDAPQMGPFQADEDVGTNIADLGFGIARFTEPLVRGTSRVLGEITGAQTLKDFGGTQEFDPTFSMRPGPVPFTDLYKPSYESYVPTDSDRARAQIDILKAADVLKGQGNNVRTQARPFLEDAGRKVADFFDLGYPYNQFGSNIADDLKEFDVVDTASVEEVTEQDPQKLPTGIVEIRNISPEDYEASNIALAKQEMEIVGRDEEGNPIPETKLLQDPEIQDLLDEIKPIELKVDVDKTEADSLLDVEEKFDGLPDSEVQELLDPIKPILSIPEAAAETQEEQEEQAEDQRFSARDAVTRKLEQPGFFGSDRFLDFIRNVGGELTRTGQMGAGLSLGASKAAEERAARELMAEQEERDFASKLRLAKAEAELAGLEGPSDAMKKELRKVGQEMNADYNDIVSAKNTLEIIGRVEEIVNNEDTSSVKAFVAEFVEKGKEFFDINGKPTDDPSKGLPFDQLESRTRAKVLLNQIKQRNIREILGESGKTISNLDRQIVEGLVGDIALGATQAETLEALRITKSSIFNNLDAAQKRLKTNFFFANEEDGLYLIPDVQTILSYLNTGTLPNTVYDSGYSSSSGIKKISLKE